MEILSLSIAQLLLGFFFVGVLFLVGCVCYATLYHHRQDQIKDNPSPVSWNDEHRFFDEITEFRNDFSGN